MEIRKLSYKFLIIVTMTFAILNLDKVSAQEVSAPAILDSVLAIRGQVVDYRAEVEIEVDVDFIEMPVKYATVLYKKPDKIKFRSDDFLLLPKRGIGMDLDEMLDEEYATVNGGTDYIEGKRYQVIKVIPNRPGKGLILSSVWIDEDSFQVRRMENFTRDGNYLLDLLYENEEKILPSEIIITFQLEDFNIPMNFVGRTIEIDKEAVRDEGPKTGKIYLRFTGYEINSGLKEVEFDKE